MAPIARLLHISLDELLSFKEELSDIEISNIIKEIDKMFDSQTVETVYQKIMDIVREYPNAETLILSLVAMLDARCFICDIEDMTRYDEWIQSCYENLLLSNDEVTKLRAADCLHSFFIRKEIYDKAEKCLEFFSIQNPERKRKLATIYCETGRYHEVYKMLEELLFSEYQIMSGAFHEIYMVAMKTDNCEKAQAILEKISGLCELFEMGEYNRISGKLD